MPAEKVAIIGKAPSSRDLAPYQDESWEIWTLSDLVPRRQVPRWDRHFEIHPLSWFEHRGDDYFSWLCSVPADAQPIYMHQADPRIPAAKPFPLHEILRAFGPYQYFTNTVSWMTAFAILEGAKQIGIFGVDMAQEKEYKAQRPSCEWLIGWAQGAGIDVIIPPQSDLLKATLLYGFQTDAGMMREKWQARTRELEERMSRKREKMAMAEQEATRYRDELNFLAGARESQEYYRQWLPEVWDGVAHPHETSPGQ